MLKKTGLFVVILSFLALLEPRSSQAQEIKVDGSTATIVTKDGDRITIDGNTFSRDGKNLFHSFKEFGLTQQQIATFLTNPNIHNILTRVTGGNPSYINGLIQVVGGNSNLFLMNPAGVVFGSGASINVPADFSATTATGIGFNNGVFSAVGSNDYSNLTGNPTNFVFNTNQPGSIINAGDLKVSEGSNINLIGGNVINTGSIETPNGKINIQAVAGTSRVKITPEGSLLSLELDIPKDEQGNLLSFTPQDLPTLLTGAHNAGVATPNVTIKNNAVGVNGINPQANGINPDNPQVQVANTTIPEGTGNSIISGKVSTSSESLGGEITVLGEKVGVIEGEITANGAQGGGKVLIGGDREGKGTIPNAQSTVVNKNSTITANATVNGDGGDVIVWTDGDTSFTGNIEAKGGENSGDGGFVEVSGKENLNFQGEVDTSAKNGNTGTLLLDPLNVFIGNIGIDDFEIADGEILAGDGGNTDFSISQTALQDLAGTTSVVIEATKNITITELVGNTLTFKSNITTGEQPRTSVTFRADADGSGEGDFSMNPEHTIIARGRDVNISGNNITIGAIDTSTPIDTNGNAGDITLNATNNISVQGTTTTPAGFPYSLGAFVSNGGVGNAGNIRLDSTNGSVSITPNNGNIIATTPSGNAGNIQLNAPNGSVNLPSNIRFESFSNSNNTGNVSLTGNNIKPSGTNSTVDFVVNNEVNLDTSSLNAAIKNTGIGNPVININSDNNLTLNKNISTNGGSFNARANGSIVVNDNVAIDSNGGSVTLNSNGDGLNGGAIRMNSGSSITADDGNIILDGGGVEVLGDGRIVTTGTTTFNTPDSDILVELTSPSDFGEVRIDNARNAILNDVNNIALHDINVTGDLTVNANGNITDSSPALGVITVGGTTSLNANGNNISLTGRDTLGGTNDFNILEIVNAQDVLISDNNSLGLGNSNVTGNLTITSQGAITDDGVIVVGGATTLNPNNNDVILDTVNNNFNRLSIENGNNVTLADINDVILQNVDALGNPVDFQIGGDLDLRVAGVTNIDSNIEANSILTDSSGSTVINGDTITTSLNQTYNDPVILAKDTVITGNNITFGSSIDGSQSLTVNSIGEGETTFNGDVGSATPLTNLTTNADGTTKLNGNVTTTGMQNYQDNVEIGNSVTLTTNNSNISFEGTVNSILEETNNLLLNTGNANITFNQAIGNTQPLGDIIANSTRITRFNNDVNANSLTTDEGGTTRLNGNVTSSGDQVYNDNVFLEKTIILDTNNLTAVSIEANRTSANPISLSINALDSVTITGKPDANSLLAISTARTNNQETGNITINANNDINLQGAVNTTATSATSLATIAGDISLASENGDVSVLAIASIGTETSGNVIISGNNIDTGVILTFLNPTNVTTGNINIQGNSTTVSGTIQGLSLTTSGTFTLAENPSILALPNRALASLGNATVNTINNQNYNNFNLLNNATLNSIQGEISFTGGVNGNDKNVSITAQNINSENITSQGGNISLTSTNGGITTENLNTSGTTGGSIELNSNTTINTADIQTTGSNGNGGDVILNANNDIEVTSINTSSNNGQGGDVNISTLGRLRVTDTIDNTDISINATGTNGGGAITIDLFPGDSENGVISDPRLPFMIGNASKNGSAGTITNFSFSIDKGEYITNTTSGNLNLKLLSRVPIDPGNAINTSTPVINPIVTFASPVLTLNTIAQSQEILSSIEREAAEKPAFIYVSFTPKGFQPRDLDAEFARREATNTQEYSRVNINQPNLQPTIALKPADDDQLDLLVITSKGEPIRVTVPVTRQQVVDSALNLSIELSSDRLDDKYKPYAKELYSWLITPIEETLKERKISNLLFILPLNIRFVPIASLYDEKTEKFLVEKYSSGLAPSLNLNDNTYRSVKDLNLLAMGAAEFAEDQQQTPLPGVKLELPTIKTVWNEQSPDNYQEFLNNNFTLETIQANLDKQPYGIIHFGTHGSFGADENEDIFIQLYNSRLNFKDIGSLGLSRSNVELMLLSACQTALGNDIAELGFAGLAVQAGVKSAIGTVWTIGDTGTLAFMTDFYGELKTQTTKAEALRQTQLNMLNGKVRKSEDGNSIITPNRSVSLEGLPEDSRQREDFSHPFYWAPFTLIGNPW